MNTRLASASTAATLSLAVAAAAFLVFCGEPDPIHLRPQEITMPTIRQLVQQMSQHLHQMRLERETVQLLSALDARTLADIGLHPSEIGSVSAEWRRTTTVTRLRIAEAPRHA